MAEQHPQVSARTADVAGVDSSLEISTLTRAKGLIFLAAGLSFLMSVYLYFGGDPQRGIFVGLWVPSILSAGCLLMVGRRHE